MHSGNDERRKLKAARTVAVTLSVALALPMWTGWPAGAHAASAEQVTRGASVSVKKAAVTVPVRIAAESLGALVEWNEAEQSVRITKGATVIVMKLGATAATVNGEEKQTGGTVELADGRTIVPIAFLSEALGVPFDWDDAGQTVQLVADDLANRASVYLYNLVRGNRPALQEASSPALQSVLSEQLTALLSQQMLPVLGEKAKEVSSLIEENGVHRNVIMQYQTAVLPAPLEVTIRFDKQGLVDDYRFNTSPVTAAYEAPAYDKPALYKEQEVVIGSGEFALPGTLTLPVGEGKHPAVVLVHGSGPNDRDSAIGGARPFKDLAAGLASQGIAVLRYEKITREHSAKLSANAKFTLQDETVEDVYKAVALLQATPGVDAARIYVAGHSQGGYAVPLIFRGDKEHSIAGAVLLAGPSANISDVLVEQQVEILNRMKQSKLPQELIGQQEQAVAVYKSQVDLIKSPEYSKDHLPAQFALGSTYWWFEQRDYVPAKSMDGITAPLLILQGENDCQVSMQQFNGWKEALAGRSNVEFKSYPKVNHLLAEYDGLSMGMEYTQPSHVAAPIIDDIVQWVKKQ